MERILDVKARQVLDSRGNPTVEVDVYTQRVLGSAMVPSGASTGKHEARELRDNTKAYRGKAVTKAVKHVNTTIKRALIGKDVADQTGIDSTLLELDGTPNKARLGANAILGTSLAVARAAAAAKEQPLFTHIAALMRARPTLPVPFANIINGGKHAAGDLEFQEFMIVPTGAKTFAQATRMVAETYHILAGIINKRYGAAATHLGDEGGFAPPIDDAEEALDLLIQAITIAGYKDKMRIAIDAAASELYHKRDKTYLRTTKTWQALKAYYAKLARNYPLISLEDPYDQEDITAWQDFTKATKHKKAFQTVGDDLLVTNPRRIRHAIDEHWCDALLLKVNQIGTLTEALRAARMAQRAGWNVMVSHRSGETEDPFIADLAVGIGCGQIKLGAPARGERTAKYNQLIRIEEYLGRKATYANRTRT
ncbi:phosphopyruvate hydratase [Candidatus Woesearchaeota archaeon]|nr:phosphopyruvate hydratase [Candidatus Woesearchaeota archaeon]